MPERTWDYAEAIIATLEAKLPSAVLPLELVANDESYKRLQRVVPSVGLIVTDIQPVADPKGINSPRQYMRWVWTVLLTAAGDQVARTAGLDMWTLAGLIRQTLSGFKPGAAATSGALFLVQPGLTFAGLVPGGASYEMTFHQEVAP